MRVVAVTTGVLITICGVVALATGEFGGFGPWLLALGLAGAGVAGLVSSLLTNRSETTVDLDRSETALQT